jgi:hypothetical protein
MPTTPCRVLVRATLVVRDVYICRKCDARQTGEAYSVETSDPLHTLSQNLPKPRFMPVGWASYLDGFDCPNHH